MIQRGHNDSPSFGRHSRMDQEVASHPADGESPTIPFPFWRLREPQTPLRVAYVIDRLSRAGTEMQLLALIRTLDRTQVEPSLVLLDGADVESQALEPGDCEVLRLGVRRLASVHAARAARTLQHYWRRNPPHIVQTYFLDSTYFAAPIAKWCGVPTVLRVRNNLGYWLTRRHRWMNRIVCRWIDATLTNSEAGRQALLEQDRLPPERVHVVPNGVDMERFPVSLWPDTSKPVVKVGCVANLRPVKNIDGLMRVAKRLRETFPRLRFDVAGDGPQRDELQSLHAQLGLGDSFRFRGSVSDVPAFLRSIDIAVLPSHSEGLSNAMLEYMAAGRAIVATDVGANRQLIDSGRNGYLVPAGDDAALAAAITRLLNEPLRAAAFGSAARRHVQAHFSLQTLACRFQNLYQQLLSHSQQVSRQAA